jgi:Ca2+-binding RTX toxin-like protein
MRAAPARPIRVDADGGDQVVEAATRQRCGRKDWGFTYTLALNVERLALQTGADGIGNAQGNVIDGGDFFGFNNVMSGLGGNDTLVGGPGADVMTGGTGRDVFAIVGIDAAVDFVTDFAAGKQGDKLDLSDVLEGFVSGTSNADDFVRFVDVNGDTVKSISTAPQWRQLLNVCVLQNTTLTDVGQALADGNLLLA